MSAKIAPDILLDTIQYLEQQKSRGVRYLRVAPELMEDLAQVSAQFAAGMPIVDARALSDDEAPANPLPGKHAMTPGEKAEFEELRKRTLACKKCAHLVRSRKQVVFGVGNENAELMFVGEAPGADEDQQGEPFVGRAGQLLTKMIQAMGLERSDVYIANILKCRPDMDTPTGNRPPTPEEMATCIPHLEEQIRLIRPRVIVALGATAMKGLVPSLKEGITRLRGHWLEYRGIPLMPTFHPSYLLRYATPATKRLCWEDLLAVMEKLEKPISRKQRNFFLSAISGQPS